VADWFWQKVDVFLAAIFVAVAGVAASQGHEVMVQYIERLSTEANEARLHLLDTQSGLRYRVMGETARAELEDQAKIRFNQLQRAEDTVVHANPLIRPLALVKNHDAGILSSTWHDFTPRVPATAGGAVYAFIGTLIGFMIYEIVKLPVLVLREPKRRKFRRRA
jgi:hypothetical protein